MWCLHDVLCGMVNQAAIRLTHNYKGSCLLKLLDCEMVDCTIAVHVRFQDSLPKNCDQQSLKGYPLERYLLRIWGIGYVVWLVLNLLTLVNPHVVDLFWVCEYDVLQFDNFKRLWWFAKDCLLRTCLYHLCDGTLTHLLDKLIEKNVILSRP